MHSPSLPRAARIFAAAATAAATTLLAPPAAADFLSSGAGATVVVVGGTLGALGAVDTMFLVNNLVDSAQGNRPDEGWATAEIVVASPQALGFNIALFALAADNDDDNMGAMFLGVPFASLTTSLTMHGIWVTSGDPVSADTMTGVSVLTGVAAAWTSAAAGRALRGGLFPRLLGATETALTTPGAALGVYKAVTDPSQRPLWSTLAAWNGLLWLHGVASLIANDTDEPGKNRPPPPDPSLRTSRGTPLSWALAPTVIPALDGPAAGVTAAGVF